MVYFSREHLLDKTEGSVYKLVVLASKRSLELAEGQVKLVDMPVSAKPSIVALREIEEGKVQLK